MLNKNKGSEPVDPSVQTQHRAEKAASDPGASVLEEGSGSCVRPTPSCYVPRAGLGSPLGPGSTRTRLTHFLPSPTCQVLKGKIMYKLPCDP